MAPANQLRLSLAGSEDGEAETETCRVAKPLWRKTNRPSGPPGLNLTEPPGADPHAGWCGRGEWATTPPMPICERAENRAAFKYADAADRESCGMARTLGSICAA